FVVLLILLFQFPLRAFAQQPADLDLTFNPADAAYNSGTGASGPVNAILKQPDSKLIIAGGFSDYNELPAFLINRIGADGKPDPSFTANYTVFFGGEAHAAALQADGKIVIGGTFTIYTPVNYQNLARINSDGTL